MNPLYDAVAEFQDLFSLQSADGFICHNDEYPVDAHSASSLVECEDLTDSKPNSSSHSENCLQRFCKLPSFPRNLTFDLHENIDDTWIVLKAAHLNAICKRRAEETRLTTPLLASSCVKTFAI